MQLAATPMIETFQYPTIDPPGPLLWRDLPEIGERTHSQESTAAREKPQAAAEDIAPVPPRSDVAASESAAAFEAGRAQGILEGRQAQKAEQDAALREHETQRIKQAAQLAEQFAHERDHFLQSAEQEVARLALAIAARILRREAQVDPLFLIGAVRVALGQLAETTKVQLRVPSAEAELWTETLSHIPNLRVLPGVVADEHLKPGDCSVETELGSADLGVCAQLGEVERLLFDGTNQDAPVGNASNAGFLS